MADFNFEELLEGYLPEDPTKGEEREVTIVKKEMIFTYLDINGKLEGRVRTEEVTDFKEGDVLKVQIINEDKDGNYVICSRRRVEQQENIGRLNEAFANGEVVKAKVIKQVKGGYGVEILKINAFMPNSLSSFRPDDKAVGKEINVIIKEVKVEKNGVKVLVSRKDVKAKKDKENFDAVDLNGIYEVEIKDLLDFGLSVTVENLSGFIHISELSWNRVEKIADKYKVGDKLQAKVIEKDKVKKSVKLSVKQLSQDPWSNIEMKYPVDAEIEGKVVRVSNFGAFVELEPGIEGLVHISDLTWSKKIKNIDDFVKIGDKIKVKVILLDTTDKKLKLSIKSLEKNPWEVINENNSVGSILKGKVVEVKDFGVFVEVEQGVDAFIHISDFAWEKVNKDYYKIGDEIEFKVIEIDGQNQKIKGSVKQLTKSPWETLKESYKVGDRVKRTVTSLTDFGMFVEVEKGIDGMIHISEVSKDFLKNISDKYKVGDEIEAEIIEINDDKEKVKFSIKKIEISKQRAEERENIEKYSVSGDNE